MEMKTILKGLFALGVLLVISLTFISLSAQREISDEDAGRIVDALMENQEYRDYLESDDWYRRQVE